MNEPAIVLSVVLPCLNEEKTLEAAMQLARELIDSSGWPGEIVVADNGSTDRSAELAQQAGARVVPVDRKGYGFALMTGIRAALGKYIVMGDADATYDFREALPMLGLLREGHDLVIGSRLRGRIEPGAMPPLHRYLGTPVLTWLQRVFFGLRISDCNCGLRVFTREAFDRMELVSGGMEFASEMLIKAAQRKLKVGEVPCSLKRDTRDRAPHLKTWRDGWRHLRFILLFAPHVVFRVPGWILTILCGLAVLRLSFGPVTLAGHYFDYHHLFYCVPLLCVGYQMLWFAAFEEWFVRFAGLARPRQDAPDEPRFALEKWLFAGMVAILVGLTVFLSILSRWWQSGRGDLLAVRSGTLGLTALLIGGLTILNALMLSMLGLRLEQRQTRADIRGEKTA